MRRIMHVLQLNGVGGVQELVKNLVFGLGNIGYKQYIYTFRDADERHIQFFKELKCNVFISPYAVNDLRNITKLYVCVKEWNIDVLHVHNTIPQILCSFLLNVFRGTVKGIVTEHSQLSKRRHYKFLRVIDELTYSQYDKIVSVSKSVEATIRKWLKHIDVSKFVVVKNGIELHRYVSAKGIDRVSMRFQNDDVIIVSVGRLNAAKGFATIIRSISLLPVNYKLLIVGDGPQRKELVELSEILNLNDRVFFAGQKSNVEEYLKSGNIYVSASHTEGFALTILEAMAAGLPVIGTDIPSFREVLPENNLFQIDDYEALAEKILSKDYDLCTNIVENYTLGSMIKGYIKVYNSL